MLGFKFAKMPYFNLLSTLRYGYVRKRQIDQISAGYGNTTMDKIKMYTKIFAHIGKQGFKGVRNDIKLFRQLRSKPRQQFTENDWNQLIRLHHDFFRLGPLLIIQILPMSGPLFILYMYTYPGSIPSWFIIDKFHQDYQKRIRVVQQQAVKYFKQKGIKPQDIKFDEMSLEQAKKLAQCLYGYHRDGTLGFQKIFKRDIQYLITPALSKYLIKRKLRYKFNADLQHEKIFQNMTFDQKIRWKYDQVVVHGKMLKSYQQSLSPQQLKARQQQQNSIEKMLDEGGHTDKPKNQNNNQKK